MAITKSGVNFRQSYSEKLKDPRWQKRRLEIMQRDNFQCCMCKTTTKTLHVDHKIYRKYQEPWEYADDDLWTLCEHCHSIISKQREKNTELISQLGVLELFALEMILIELKNYSPIDILAAWEEYKKKFLWKG